MAKDSQCPSKHDTPSLLGGSGDGISGDSADPVDGTGKKRAAAALHSLSHKIKYNKLLFSVLSRFPPLVFLSLRAKSVGKTTEAAAAQSLA